MRTTSEISHGFGQLYSGALPATRQGPLYNAVSYPTKISPEAVALFIATHSRVGDTILDPFSGSGSTGLAAILCERPTPRMLAAAADRGLTPAWGPRNAELFDISEFGTLIARVLTSPPDPTVFLESARRVLEGARAATEGWYSAADPAGRPGTIRHIVWSEVLVCPRCGHETAYADARVRYSPLRFEDDYVCPCGNPLSKDTPRAIVSSVDPLTQTMVEQRKRVPWKVYGRSANKNWSRPANADDVVLARDVARVPVASSSPVTQIAWGDLHRAGYHMGMTHLHHLYTERNFRVMSLVWEGIASEPAELQEALKLLALSFNASHSTLMTRVVLKKDSKDFILTGAQSGVLYVSAMPVEKNVLIGVERKLKTFTEAFALTYGARSKVNVHTASSTSMSLPSNSIDYVFTDPPFGDYIPYAEVNQVNELWLGQATDNTSEAVVSISQGKGVGEYGALLTEVFKEIGRTLVSHGKATVVFHSASAKIWQALGAALSDAGLEVELASTLDKTQGSFKQGLGDSSVKGDPLLLVRHANADAFVSVGDEGSNVLVENLLADALKGPSRPENTRERVYSRYLGETMMSGAQVTIDAREFYKRYAEQEAKA